MAHCGGSPTQALHYVTGAIANAPDDPQAYDVLANLWEAQKDELEEFIQNGGSLQTVLAFAYISFLKKDWDRAVMSIGGVVGAQPTVAWADAPWFREAAFRAAVSAEAVAEAVMRTMDHGRDLDTPAVRGALGPWFDLIDLVCAREPLPEPMAKMAVFLRACGSTDASLRLCDRADAIEPIMYTEVVRAGTWRKLGDPDKTMAAFQRAVALEPANWSLFLDMADLAAEQEDFARAVHLAEQGLEHEPNEVLLRAARLAYRARLTGSPDDVRELIELFPQMSPDSYRDLLIDFACAGPDLPLELIAEVRSSQDG